MRSVLPVLAVVVCSAVAEAAVPSPELVQAQCQAWIDAVTVMAVGKEIDLSGLRALADEDVLRFYTYPHSLGTPVEGYTFDSYKSRLQPIYSMDPFVEYNFTSTKFYSTTVGTDADMTHACFIHGSSSALTESGRSYGQDYILTLEMDSELKLTSHYEYADALYSACFYKILPTAVCTALGQ